MLQLQQASSSEATSLLISEGVLDQQLHVLFYGLQPDLFSFVGLQAESPGVQLLCPFGHFLTGNSTRACIPHLELQAESRVDFLMQDFLVLWSREPNVGGLRASAVKIRRMLCMYKLDYLDDILFRPIHFIYNQKLRSTDSKCFLCLISSY